MSVGPLLRFSPGESIAAHPNLENEILVASAERFGDAAQEALRFRDEWRGVPGFEAVGIMLETLHDTLAGGVASITSVAPGTLTCSLSSRSKYL